MGKVIESKGYIWWPLRYEYVYDSRVEWESVPLFFGRSFGQWYTEAFSDVRTWDLSDFGFGVYRVVYWDKVIRYWVIRNLTRGDREVDILVLKSSLENGTKVKTWCIYNTNNGEILSVVKSSEGVVLPEITIPGTGFLSLDSNPEKEMIFQIPENYVVDLSRLWVVKR